MYDYKRLRKPFEAPDLAWAAMNLWWAQMGFTST